MTKEFKREALACLTGIVIGGLIIANFVIQKNSSFYGLSGHEDDYHIHADFLVEINGEVLDLGVAEFMTSSEQMLHNDAHLHDEDGDVLHMHAENISFVEFLNSIEITLEEDCLSVKDVKFCADEKNILSLYVNNEIWTDNFESYVPTDLDRVLLYYGEKNGPRSESFEAVLDNACIYSGSCPERGIAPPESCGLTCEL